MTLPLRIVILSMVLTTMCGKDRAQALTSFRGSWLE